MLQSAAANRPLRIIIGQDLPIVMTADMDYSIISDSVNLLAGIIDKIIVFVRSAAVVIGLWGLGPGAGRRQLSTGCHRISAPPAPPVPRLLE